MSTYERVDLSPTCTPVISWHGCYDGSWKGLIVDEAFAHPAKMAKGLIERIVMHMLERGYIHKGECVGDPFGGIGTGGIIAAYNGLRWIGVELEPRFAALAQRNFALHRVGWKACGDPEPVLVQGDSRRFAEIVGEAAAIVTSPPFASIVATQDPNWLTPGERGKRLPSKSNQADYGDTPGQIGSLRSGDVDAVCTSPPYNLPMSQEHPGRAGGERGTTPSETGAFVKYGGADGQIEGLPQGSVDSVITSPPYAECVKGDHGETETAAETTAKRNTPGGSLGKSARHGGYGSTEGQIGALREGAIDAICTSPPWEKQEAANAARKHADPEAVAAARSEGYASGRLKGNFASKEAILRSLEKSNAQVYGDSDGQLGNTSGETYWAAMRAVYEQCRLALKPGGIMAVVIKDYIKAGQRVPLCDQTLQLLEHLGFEPVERIRAWLVSETVEAGLLGDITTKKERKSFFRRLYEKRPGAVRIDWEEVIVVRAPGATEGGGV